MLIELLVLSQILNQVEIQVINIYFEINGNVMVQVEGYMMYVTSLSYQSPKTFHLLVKTSGD